MYSKETEKAAIIRSLIFMQNQPKRRKTKNLIKRKENSNEIIQKKAQVNAAGKR